MRSASIALSVGEAWAVARPMELLELSPGDLRGRAEEMARAGIAAFVAVSDWKPDELLDIIHASTLRHGPYRFELSRLRARSNGDTIRTYYEVDENSARILVASDGQAMNGQFLLLVERGSPVASQYLLAARSTRVRHGRLEYVTAYDGVEQSVGIETR